MADSMVLLQRTTATPLPNMEPGEKDYGDVQDDYNAVASAITRMNERENTYLMKQIVRRKSPTKGDLTPRSVGTPRTTRSQFLSTPRSCSFLGTNATVLNERVPLTQRNSAISSGYASPRQLTLSASHLNRGDSGVPPRLRKIHETRSASFDYDANEDITLEDVKYFKRPRLPVKRTEVLYQKACALCGITPSQNYAKQTVTSRSILMSNCSLSHLTVKPIAISLVKDYRIHTLDVSGNHIGPLGVMYLAEMLEENDTLYELNLSGTYPGEEGLRVLAEMLPKNRSVHILRLESNSIDHTETHLLVEMIEKTPNLAELFLGHNNLGYEGGKLLAKSLETNFTLRTLDLRWNHFRKESAKQLCSSVGRNVGLRRLNVSWNGLGKEGCIALAKSLPKNRTLVDLDLTCNRIDVVGLPFLLHGLVRNSNLERLKLGKNPLTTDGAKAVVKAITGANSTKIKELDLEEVPVDHDFTLLVEQMKETRNIEVIHAEAKYGAIELQMKEHDPHDLNRFDPVMVLIEYIRIDNLRLIDLFQFFDTHNRGMLSRSDLRDGVATLGLPLTEHHLDCIMQDIDSKRDGYIDLEEFMNAQREMGKIVTQRTTKAKGKGKEDLGLKELRKILKELVEKRNTRNKEKAAKKMNSAWTGAVNKVKVMDAIEQKEKQAEDTIDLPMVDSGKESTGVKTTGFSDWGKSINDRIDNKQFVKDANKDNTKLKTNENAESAGGMLPDITGNGQIYGIGKRQEFIEKVDTPLAWTTPRKQPS